MGNKRCATSMKNTRYDIVIQQTFYTLMTLYYIYESVDSVCQKIQKTQPLIAALFGRHNIVAVDISY